MKRAEQPVISLYRKALGETFDRLPTALWHFHANPEDAAAAGVLRITRGSGWLRNTLATLMRLPPQGEQVPVSLQVHLIGEQEQWTRDFGSLRLITRQWFWRGLLLEAAGPLRFGFRLTADATGMRFEFARCWFLGAPLPLALSPQVHAEARDQETGWWISVRVEVPVLGVLVQYEGEVRPQC